MKPECAAVVKATLGREPTKGELDAIETRIHGSMKELQAKDPAAWSGLSREARLEAGAKLARKKSLEDQTKAHSLQLRDLEIKSREIENLGNVEAGVGKGKGHLNALNQRILFSAERGGKGTSLETDANAEFSNLTYNLDHSGLQNPAAKWDITREIRGEDSGNPKAKAAAKTLIDAMERGHQAAVDAGIKINHLDDWRSPQHLAWESVGAQKPEFIRDAMDHIDRSKFIESDGSPMSDKRIFETVKATAETVSSDGANKKQEGNGGGFGGKVAASRNAPRQLHYKDAASYQFMMEKYGVTDDPYSMGIQHLRGLSRDIATAKRFGTDADGFVPQLIARAFKADADAIGAGEGTVAQKKVLLKKLEGQQKTTQSMYDAFRHPDAPGDKPMWAKVSANIRGVANASLQGGFLGAIPDIQMARSYTQLRGVPALKLYSNMLEGLKPTKENVALINRMGIVPAHIEASASRHGNEDMSTQGVKFLNHAVHVAGLLRMFDRGQTHGVAASLMDLIGEHSHKTEFGNLDPATAKMAEQYGWSKDHWDVWRQAELETGPGGNHSMLTPDSIFSIPDEKLAGMATDNVTNRGDKPTPENIAQETRNLRSDASAKLLSSVLSDTKIGARGGSGTSARGQLQMGARGTLAGEAAAWALLLKQTPLGIFKTHMIDVPKSLDTWGAAAMYRAKFMAGSAALGAVGIELKDLVLGQDPENLMTPAGLGKLAMACGGFGMYGDLMFGDKGDHKNGTLAKMLGPGATMIEDAVNLAKAAQHTAAGTVDMADEEAGKPVPADKLGAQALQFAHSYTAPLTRLWYVKAAFNHVVYQQMMENMVPGYSQRVEQRMGQRDQSNWWPTGQLTPQRAPSLNPMLGQQP